MSEVITAVAAVFIVAMVWLRTRMHYAAGTHGRLRLSAAGALYFAALGALLLIGWFAAPQLALPLPSAAPPSTPVLARVVWFLATYYLFIVVHRALKSRGLAVFRH